MLKEFVGRDDVFLLPIEREGIPKIFELCEMLGDVGSFGSSGRAQHAELVRLN